MAATCTHLDQIDSAVSPSGQGCVECTSSGGHWVHLRMCRNCGHVGCCDQSPGRHATAHFAATGHQLISSYEPAESWWWCFVDEVGFELPDEPQFSYE